MFRSTRNRRNKMLTLKELIKNQKNFNESFFAEVSDKLWEIGEIEEIKNQTAKKG